MDDEMPKLKNNNVNDNNSPSELPNDRLSNEKGINNVPSGSEGIKVENTLNPLSSGVETSGLNPQNLKDQALNKALNVGGEEEGPKVGEKVNDGSGDPNQPKVGEKVAPGKKVGKDGTVQESALRRGLSGLATGAAAYAGGAEAAEKVRSAEKTGLGNRVLNKTADMVEKVPGGKQLEDAADKLGIGEAGDAVNNVVDVMSSAKNGDIKGAVEGVKKAKENIKEIKKKYLKLILIPVICTIAIVFMAFFVIASPVIRGYLNLADLFSWVTQFGEIWHGEDTDPGNEYLPNAPSIGGTPENPVNGKMSPNCGGTSVRTHEGVAVPLNGDFSSKIASIARSQIGCKEGSNNHNNYGFNDGSTNDPWCVYFATWVLRHAGYTGPYPMSTASTSAARQIFKDLGRFHQTGTGYTPKVGDFVLYQAHTGIVVGVDADGTIHTVEGNTSDQVKEYTISPGTSRYSGITGFGSV